MVSHGANIYWHIYPQQEGCPQGCQTEANPGNSNFLSFCAPHGDTFEVRCCSDTPIAALEGDNENQAYTQNGNGRCGNPNNGGIAGTMGPNDPYAAGHVINFADQNDDPSDDDGCAHAKSFEEAEAICAADGARLCTQAEVESNCDHNSGCENAFEWTSTPCTPEPEFVCSRFTHVSGPAECELKDEWTWMDRDCEVQVQVDNSGYITIVHGGEDANWNVWSADNVREAYAVDHGDVSKLHAH